MKIGILTYHHTTNYGAILQSYALQKKIAQMGCDCEIIDYECKAVEERYKIKRIREISNLKEFIKHILTKKNKKKLNQKFKQFSQKYQSISVKRYNKDTIEESNEIYDKYIVGSDQVWNLQLSGEDTTYMLDFVRDDRKKNSYAASFGYRDIPEKYKKVTKELIIGFENISVREKEGKEILEKLIGRDIEVVLDPTLLLDQEEWNSIITTYNHKTEEPFILLYIIASTPSIIQFTRQISEKTGYKVVYINHSYKNIRRFINIHDASPEEFLWYIKNAKYVITSSFHGVALSIKFNKQFFYELSKDKNNFNSRIENLVNILGLNERKIEQGINNKINETINYVEVNGILKDEINKSVKYLDNIVRNK